MGFVNQTAPKTNGWRSESQIQRRAKQNDLEACEEIKFTNLRGMQINLEINPTLPTSDIQTHKAPGTHCWGRCRECEKGFSDGLWGCLLCWGLLQLTNWCLSPGDPVPRCERRTFAGTYGQMYYFEVANLISIELPIGSGISEWLNNSWCMHCIS